MQKLFSELVLPTAPIRSDLQSADFAEHFFKQLTLSQDKYDKIMQGCYKLNLYMGKDGPGCDMFRSCIDGNRK